MCQIISRISSVIFGSLVIASCGSTLESESVFLGTIEEDSESAPAVVEAPSQSVVGEEFNVTVVTYADSGCEEAGPTTVNIEGLRATVLPFDRRNGSRFCSDHAQVLEHQAKVRFEQAGLAEIVVRGLSAERGDTIEVVREVVVN